MKRIFLALLTLVMTAMTTTAQADTARHNRNIYVYNATGRHVVAFFISDVTRGVWGRNRLTNTLEAQQIKVIVPSKLETGCLMDFVVIFGNTEQLPGKINICKDHGITINQHSFTIDR